MDQLSNLTVHELHQFHHILLENGADILALLSERGEFLYCVGSSLKNFGFDSNQLIGKNFFTFLHPEDIKKAEEVWGKILCSTDAGTIVTDLRFQTADGHWRWLETRVSNKLHYTGVKALVTSSRDITERVEFRIQLQESEQRFKALFEANPDMVIFEDKEGRILDINPAFTNFFGLIKDEILHSPLSDYLPPIAFAECNRYLKSCLEGKHVNFEMDIHFEELGHKRFQINKIPVEVNKEIVGVYSILKDISAITSSHNIIKDQAKKLNAIFESITDAFFTIDKNWNFTYINCEFERLLGVPVKESTGHNIWNIFPEEVNGEFHHYYQRAMETGQAVHFESYLARVDKWLQVKAFPSQDGLSVYFDDISEIRKSRQELELLSMVASKTINGVMILDANGVTEWVNEGFTKITGFSYKEAVGKFPRSILQGPETDVDTVKRIQERIKEVKPFREEILNYRKSGEKFWLLIELTPVTDGSGKIIKIINIQTDITSRKEAEESRLQLTQDLYRQNRDLQHFAYMVSHNLRGPVANAMGLTNLLDTLNNNSSDFKLTLGYLNKSILQLDTVLKDLNHTLSIRHNKDTLEKEKVNLRQLCNESIASLRGPLENCNAKVSLNVGEDIFLTGSNSYYHSIFSQLLSNAIRFRPRESPLEVKIIAIVNSDSSVKISIADNGIGFNREMADNKVFNLYKKFHSSSEGRGIGLFLVRTYLEAMDGYIEVESQVGKGTCFHLFVK